MQLASLLDAMTEHETTHHARRASHADDRLMPLLLLDQLTRTSPGSWRTHAACVVMDPEVFHRRADASHAIEACRPCPVLDDCRRWILSLTNEADAVGVYAAMTIDERRAMRARATAASE